MPPKKKLSTEHIFIITDGEFHGKVHCTHCGAYEKYNELLPLPIDLASLILNYYVKRHKGCKKPKG